MRKLLFCLVATVSFAACMVSCSHGTASKADADSTTAIADVTDSLAVDSVFVDSVK